MGYFPIEDHDSVKEGAAEIFPPQVDAFLCPHRGILWPACCWLLVVTSVDLFSLEQFYILPSMHFYQASLEL